MDAQLAQLRALAKAKHEGLQPQQQGPAPSKRKAPVSPEAGAPPEQPGSGSADEARLLKRTRLEPGAPPTPAPPTSSATCKRLKQYGILQDK